MNTCTPDWSTDHTEPSLNFIGVTYIAGRGSLGEGDIADICENGGNIDASGTVPKMAVSAEAHCTGLRSRRAKE